jgi:hypothetical protein
MSNEIINTSIYNDNIQSITTINTELYTNKIRGNIILGNNNVSVNINNLSVSNLSVSNLSLNNVNVNNLIVNNNIEYNQPSGTTLYINSTNTITETIPSSSYINQYTMSNGVNIQTLTITGSILKKLINSIIFLNLNCTTTPDISGVLQYKFQIETLGGSILLTSNLSDDINDLSTNPIDVPTSYTCSIYSNTNLNNIIETDTFNFKIITNNTLINKKLNIYYYESSSRYSSITILNNYNIGYTQLYTNNYIFANPTSGLQDNITVTLNNEIEFGLPMYLSKGIWNINFYTTINPPSTSFCYLILIYKDQDYNIIETNYSYNYFHTAVLSSIYISTNIAINNNNRYITPFIRVTTGQANTFKNTNGSGFKIMRIV